MPASQPGDSWAHTSYFHAQRNCRIYDQKKREKYSIWPLIPSLFHAPQLADRNRQRSFAEHFVLLQNYVLDYMITRSHICRLNQRRWAAKTTLCRFQFNNINYKILQSHSIWIMLFALGLRVRVRVCVCLYCRYPTICAIETNLGDVVECKGTY